MIICIFTNLAKHLLYTILVVSLFAQVNAQSQNYYINSITGDNNNDGLSPSTAWASLTKVNSTQFMPGDSILFSKGSEWEGVLQPKGSGEPQKPIVVSSYGSGDIPIINGNGRVPNAVKLYNQEYWVISNLEITNYKENDTSIKRGVYVQGQDYGVIHNIKLLNLVIHNVNSDIEEKDGGGIFIEITGNSEPTYFDSLIVEGCRIYDVDRTGLSNQSSWSTRTYDTNTNWVPSTNYIVRNNWIERSGGNGMIIRVSSKPLIEHNVLKQCGLKTSGNALFTFNCDDALVQYNESFLTVYNPGDVDASGFDSDYRCKRSIYQYNYSHDNDGGFMVVVCQGGDTRFNDSTIVRYNISQNDGGNIFRISGQTTNTFIYNNTIYSDSSNDFDRVIWHKSWAAYPDNTFYYNNIFQIHKTPRYSFSSSTNNFFSNNLFYGEHSSDEPADQSKIIADPLLTNPGSGSVGFETLDGYKLQEGSPCIDRGLTLDNNGGYDFWNNTIGEDDGIDVGAHEYQLTTSIKGTEIPKGFKLNQNYPNPFNPETKIAYSIPETDLINITVFNSIGEVIKTIKNETQLAGNYEVSWSGISDKGVRMPTGVYFCRLQWGSESEIVKMLLIK